MVRHLVTAAVFALVLVGAPGCPKYPVPDPPPGPYPEGETCASACAHVAELGCRLGQPTPAGVECEEVCSSAVVPWGLGCLTVAENCEQVDGCPDNP